MLLRTVYIERDGRGGGGIYIAGPIYVRKIFENINIELRNTTIKIKLM